jgi:hypothetical protein
MQADIRRGVNEGFAAGSLLGRLREPAVVLEDPLPGKRLLEPVEELSGRIYLVVMLALAETVISWRYSAGHRTVSLMWKKPFSIARRAAALATD